MCLNPRSHREFFQSWEASLLMWPSAHLQMRNNEKPRWLGISDDEIWATVTAVLNKGKRRIEARIGCSASAQSQERSWSMFSWKIFPNRGNKNVIRNNQHIYQRQITLVRLSCLFRLKLWLCRGRQSSGCSTRWLQQGSDTLSYSICCGSWQSPGWRSSLHVKNGQEEQSPKAGINTFTSGVQQVTPGAAAGARIIQ